MNRRDLIKIITASSAWLVASPAAADQLNFTNLLKKNPFGAIAKLQKKTRLPFIVLDPGHGGVDPGTIGYSGIYEKIVTLDIALKAAARLNSSGLCQCILTRSHDVFIPLLNRPLIASQAGADLFISIHADSARNRSTSGLSIYTLSDEASDDMSLAIATNENISNVLNSEHNQVISNMLFDLSRRRNLNLSLQNKKKIINFLSKKINLLEKPMRSANFAVLRNSSVPSVLIETGFLSNKRDEKILKSPSGRGKIAKTLADSFIHALTQA